MLLLSSKHGGFERRVRFFPVFHLLMPLLSSHGFLVAPSSFHFVTRHNKQQHHNRGGGSHHDHDASSLNSALFSSGSRRSSALSLAASPYLSAETVYFDIQVAGQDVGRLIFDLTVPSPLPLHAGPSSFLHPAYFCYRNLGSHTPLTLSLCHFFFRVTFFRRVQKT